MRVLATSISMYVCMHAGVPAEIKKKMHYYDLYRSNMGIFTAIVLFVLGQNMTQIWKYRLGKLYFTTSP